MNRLENLRDGAGSVRVEPHRGLTRWGALATILSLVAVGFLAGACAIRGSSVPPVGTTPDATPTPGTQAGEFRIYVRHGFAEGGPEPRLTTRQIRRLEEALVAHTPTDLRAPRYTSGLTKALTVIYQWLPAVPHPEVLVAYHDSSSNRCATSSQLSSGYFYDLLWVRWQGTRPALESRWESADDPAWIRLRPIFALPVVVPEVWPIEGDTLLFARFSSFWFRGDGEGGSVDLFTSFFVVDGSGVHVECPEEDPKCPRYGLPLEFPYQARLYLLCDRTGLPYLLSAGDPATLLRWDEPDQTFELFRWIPWPGLPTWSNEKPAAARMVEELVSRATGVSVQLVANDVVNRFAPAIELGPSLFDPPCSGLPRDLPPLRLYGVYHPGSSLPW
jgi:hypothetical protein